MFLLLRAEDELCEWLMLVGGGGEDALKQNRNGLKSNHSSQLHPESQKEGQRSSGETAGKASTHLALPIQHPLHPATVGGFGEVCTAHHKSLWGTTDPILKPVFCPIKC